MLFEVRSTRNYHQLLYVSALLALLWLFVVPLLYHNIQESGACAYPSEFNVAYWRRTLPGAIDKVRLEESYQTWADKLQSLDGGRYISSALGFADGKGIASRKIVDGKVQYEPYYLQGAGTPFLIGITIKLFGSQHVFPYFVLVCLLHLLTAIGVLFFAAGYTERFSTQLLIGSLSLLSLPIMYQHFGFGLCGSEPPSEVLLIVALISLQNFWQHGRNNWRQSSITAISFGVFIGAASYFRGVDGLFGLFCCVCVVLVSFRKGFKNAAIFSVTACLTLALVQLPWEIRNQQKFGEFTMQDTQYCQWNLLLQHWVDWRVTAMYFPVACCGLGDYLRHDLSAQMTSGIWADKRSGSSVAAETLIKEILRHPRKAFLFKISCYDALWLGSRTDIAVRLFTSISLASFLILAWKNRRLLPPELWTFPLFMLCLSVAIFYESRFVHPFYFYITPVSIGLLIEHRKGDKAAKGSKGAKASAFMLNALLVLPVLLLLLLPFGPWIIKAVDESPFCQQALGFMEVSGSENILFGDSVRLVNVYMQKRRNSVEIKAFWCADEHAEKGKYVGVHIVDSNGSILRQFDHLLLPQALPVSKGVAWCDRFTIPINVPAGAKAIALSVYEDPQQTFLIQGGHCDWGNHRLLLPLQAF